MQFKKKSVFHVWSDVCSPNTHTNMLKGDILQHVGQLKHVQHVICTFASFKHCCIFPWHTLKKTKKPRKPAWRRVARSPAQYGWIHMKSCLKYVHILGCFLVWFPCLSSAKKRSWDKCFLSFARFWTLFHKLHVSSCLKSATSMIPHYLEFMEANIRSQF